MGEMGRNRQQKFNFPLGEMGKLEEIK